MNKWQKISLLLLRLTLGGLFLYAGASKIMTAGWSAAGYLNNAKQFATFYHWLATPGILPFINFINEWGLALLGLSLILGIGVRLSSWLGAVLMFLYYLPLGWLHPNVNSLVVDEHIIFICALFVLGAFRAGRAWGLADWCARLPLCKRWPRLRNLLG